MKTYLLAISFCSLAFLSAKGQTDPLYAQYLNNPFVINPAYAGNQNNLNASLSYRKQWAGFDGSPVTMNLSAHSAMVEKQMGGGLMIVHDKIGVYKNTDVLASYAYRIDLGKQMLSFGLQAGATTYRIDNSDLNVYDPNGSEFNSNQSFTKPSFGAGILLSGDRFMVGLSVPRLIKHEVGYTGDNVSVYSQHYYLTGAYSIFVSDRVRFKPSVLVKGVKGAPLSADFNFTFNVDEKYSTGIYTRNFNAYGVLLQAKLGDKYRFGYAFEMPTNSSVGTRFISHEVTLGVNLAVFKFHDVGSVATF
jgi:type IX secretion system PorP/SprF family membrane protein